MVDTHYPEVVVFSIEVKIRDQDQLVIWYEVAEVEYYSPHVYHKQI